MRRYGMRSRYGRSMAGRMMRRSARRSMFRTGRYYRYHHRPFRYGYRGFRGYGYGPISLRASLVLMGISITIAIVIIIVTFIMLSPYMLL